MLRYLDNNQNKKGKPNENFSRELLELFTAGIGAPGQPNYTEQDVREGARGLTGWSYVGGRNQVREFAEQPRFVAVPRLHDDGNKTYLGKSGQLHTRRHREAGRQPPGYPPPAYRRQAVGGLRE